jgi:lipopolysaccharide export system protein LptA
MDVLKPPLRKNLSFRFVNRWLMIGGLITLMGVFVWAHAAVAASQPTGTQAQNSENEKIRIIADKLLAEIDAGVIEFVGNVKATQAETVVTSDRLKIMYTPEANKEPATVLKPVAIEKIIASGNVKIRYNKIIAETDEAEYTIKSGILVLKGEQSKVTQEGQSITGTKFTLHREDGKITVESSAQNRVKAVFHPSEKVK